MGLGSKIRGVVNTIGQKSKLISKLGHKGAGVVGLFDKSAGKDLNQVADIADKVGKVDEAVGAFGKKTHLFKKGGVVGRAENALKQGAMGALGGGMAMGPIGALGGGLGGAMGGFARGQSAMSGGEIRQQARRFVGPVSRTGLTHLATAGLGAGAKLLAQPHDQLRKRDIITEGGKLSRQARAHLRGFR